jgi:hypothetical protein
MNLDLSGYEKKKAASSRRVFYLQTRVDTCEEARSFLASDNRLVDVDR